MQKIVPHLWFDKEAGAAAKFYAAAFGDAKVLSVETLRGTPSGDVEVVAFRVLGHDFTAISAGPLFKINPSISFHVKCKDAKEVERLWAKLSPGGLAMMELGEYPFSKRYGWIQDRFGVSWQVILTEGEFSQRITPALMFVGGVSGRAEEAMGFYAAAFGDGRAEVLARYGKDEAPDREGSVKFARFFLAGQEFAAMDSAQAHEFAFNEAVSLMVNCRDQAEIDYFWGKLSAVPEAERCGWLKDKFGVSWQVVPANMAELMARNPEKTMPVMLAMKKIVIADLEQAGKK